MRCSKSISGTLGVPWATLWESLIWRAIFILQMQKLGPGEEITDSRPQRLITYCHRLGFPGSSLQDGVSRIGKSTGGHDLWMPASPQSHTSFQVPCLPVTFSLCFAFAPCTMQMRLSLTNEPENKKLCGLQAVFQSRLLRESFFAVKIFCP